MYFKFENNNPKNRKVNDCAIRAISSALEQHWTTTFRELSEISIEKYDMVNSKRVFSEYLKRKGLTMQKQLRKPDNTRYSVNEFIENFAKSNKIYIISVRKHLSCIKDNLIHDTWDCGQSAVGNYWVIDK